MLEIVPCEAVIVACHGRPEALDDLPGALGLVLRIARDEAWLVGSRSRRMGLLKSASLWLESADPNGLAIDQTDGWAIYSLRGDGALDAIGRLSVTRVPTERPALLQGALSGVPGKIVLTGESLYLFVPASVGHHLEARLLATCGDFGAILAASAPFVTGSRNLNEASR